MTLTIEELQELLAYDPESGKFTWKVSVGGRGKRGTSGRRAVGSPAGGYAPNGYHRIRVSGQQYLGHRLAWAFTHGTWPIKNIDHIDGDITNNKISNLRDVSQAHNIQNQRNPHPRNTSGFLGVGQHTQYKKWRARITVEGKERALGVFDTPDAASEAYLKAKRDLHEGCTI